MVIEYVGKTSAGTEMRNAGSISWFIGEKIESWTRFTLRYAIAAVAWAQTGSRSGKRKTQLTNYHSQYKFYILVFFFGLFHFLAGIWRWSFNIAMSSTTCGRWITDRFGRFARTFARLLGMVWTNSRTKFHRRHHLSRSIEKVHVNWNRCTPFIGQWIAWFNFNHSVCDTKSHGHMGLSIAFGSSEPVTQHCRFNHFGEDHILSSARDIK